MRCFSALAAFMLVGASLVPGFLAAQEPEMGYLEIRATGGRIYGKLVNQNFKETEKSPPSIVIESNSGGLIQFERSQANWRKLDPLVTEYDQIAANVSDTTEAHWKVLNWCLEQSGGKTKLKDQIEFHLLKIIDLDPNDSEAQKLLTRDGWKKFDGTWHREEQFYAAHGYVKPRSRWIPKLQVDIDAQAEQTDQAQGELRAKFVQWKRQLGRRTDAESVADLRAIATADMIPLIAEESRGEKDARLRRVYLDVMGQIPCVASQNGLIHALLDEDQALRDRALAVLLSPPFDVPGGPNRFTTAQKLVPLLSHPNNDELQWGAYCIGELGQQVSILNLINVIQTTHRMRNPAASDPNRMNIGMQNGGSGLTTGSSQPQTIERTYINEKVLAALKKITNADMGKSPDNWRQWYLDNFTLADVDVFRN